MRFRTHPRRDEPEINLIPLIDVLLVILIFLMITTTYSRYTELRIQLPQAQAEPAANAPPRIVVSVSAKGTYAVDRQVLDDTGSDEAVGTLTERLRRAAAASGEPPVVIVNADAQASHQAVINVMEAARLAGLPRLTFATQTAQAGPAR